jgi:hypothetical protein
MSPASQVEVRLTEDQRVAPEPLVHTGTHPAHATRRARILLRADAGGPGGWPDERIAEAPGINRMTVARGRSPFAAEGLGATRHAQARVVAGQGGGGAERGGAAVPGPAHPGPGGAPAGGGRRGAEPERGGGEGRLAVHRRRRPGEAQTALPNN